MVAHFGSFDAVFAAFGAGRRSSCPTCLAVVEAGQPFCLECGGPLRGRLGPHTGPRSPTAIAAITLVLIAAVAGGAYVVLGPGPSPATGTAAGSAAASVKPPVAASTGATTPIKPTTIVKTAVPPKIPAVTPTPKPAVGATTSGAAKTTTPAATVKPTAPAATTPATAPAATSPASGTTPAATTPATSVAAPTVPLDAKSVAAYNPYGAPAASFGSAAKAVRGDPLSSWTYKLDPATGGVTKAGLAINLKPARSVKAIALTTGSPGMTVEFYGAVGSLPALITDPGWVHLASRGSIDPQATVALDAQGKKFDYLLIWITHAPPGVNAGALTLSDVSVVG
jgi:hypothetical protein